MLYFILLLKTKKDCIKVKSDIEIFLKDNLEIELNCKSRYYPYKMGVNFCGYRIFTTHRLLRLASKKKIKKNIKKWNIQYDNGTDTIYVDRKIKSNIDYTFLPPDGGSSGEGDVEDGKDDALQNAINNGTSAIIDSNKQTQNAIQNQTEAIQENTETNKGIWETIKGIFDVLNPLSENFFVYKFLELFVEAMKAIFIPSNEFLSSFFSDLSTWFSDRLGFLWSPFDITIQVLNKIVNINFSEPIIYIPDINEPFTNTKLISSYTFRFNDLLNNDDFSNVYDVYLLVCDAIIYLGLMILAYKKIKEVFKG